MSSKITFTNKGPEKVHIELKQVGVLHFENDVQENGGQITFMTGKVWFTIEVRVGETRYDVLRDCIQPILKSLKVSVLIAAELATLLVSRGNTDVKLGALNTLLSALNLGSKMADIAGEDVPAVYKRHGVYMSTDKIYEIDRGTDGIWKVTKIENVRPDGHSNPLKNAYCGQCAARLEHAEVSNQANNSRDSNKSNSPTSTASTSIMP